MGDTNFSVSGIGKYIANNFLKVPKYQRSYAWEEQHILDLLHDIDNSGFDKKYFIGTIVVVKTNGNSEIIDGQQRLATVSIMFSVMQDIAIREGADKDFCKDYLSKKEFSTEDGSSTHKPKLVLNDKDNNFYRKIVIEREKFDPKKESHKRILAAYNTILKFLNKQDKVVEYIVKLEKFLENKLEIVVVGVTDEADAYTIFETLNDRGLALSQVDLIKNYLFAKSPTRVSEAQEKWTAVTSIVEANGGEQEILQYIRYFWSSKYGMTRERDLFRKIKESVETEEQAINFLVELENSVKYYIAILSADNDFWNNFHDCKNYIHTFKELRLTQNRPLLLSILKQFDNKNISKSIKLLVDWSIRNLIVGKSSGTLELEFSNQAKAINNRNVKNSEELQKSINDNELVATDEQFKEQFRLKTFSKHAIARYFLREIEDYTASNTPEKSTIKNPNVVNLEHILPQNDWKDRWPNFDDEEHKSYYKRIGNMTLLNKKQNSEQKSDAFEKKKEEAYKNSEIIITKKLADYDAWNPADIEKRQKELADIAVKVWSFKI